MHIGRQIRRHTQRVEIKYETNSLLSIRVDWREGDVDKKTNREKTACQMWLSWLFSSGVSKLLQHSTISEFS
jgi:hypothetical protein